MVRWAPLVEQITIGLFAHSPGSCTKKCAMLNNVVNDPKAHTKLLASATLTFAGRCFPSLLQHSSAVQYIRLIVHCPYWHLLSSHTRTYDFGTRYFVSLLASHHHDPHTCNSYKQNQGGAFFGTYAINTSTAVQLSVTVQKNQNIIFLSNLSNF